MCLGVAPCVGSRGHSSGCWGGRWSVLKRWME